MAKNSVQNTGNKEGTLPQRRRKGRYLWLLWLFVAVPLVYFAVQVAVILAPTMQYEIATLHSMTEAVSVVGQVVLNSQPIYSGAAGHPYYTVPTGQRVTAGADIALVFENESAVQAMDNIKAIEEEIINLEDAQATMAQGKDMDSLLQQLQEGLYTLLDSAEKADYTDIDAAQNQMALSFNKMQIAAGDAASFAPRIQQLNQLKDQYSAMAQPLSTVQATAAGFFVPSSLQDAVPMDYAAISALSPPALKEALKNPPTFYGADVFGHIVSDFKWYFITTVSAQEAEKFVVGDKSLQLSFTNQNNLQVPVQVSKVQVHEESGTAKVELYCEYVSPQVLLLRVEEAQVLFAQHKGVRISKSALRMMDVKDQDGNINTYKGVYIEFGNMVYFKRIQIIMEDNFYMLVPNEVIKDVNEVRVYDKVVIDPGGVELYDEKIM